MPPSWRVWFYKDLFKDSGGTKMRDFAFYIQAIVDGVAVGFYVEASSHTEASNEALREGERRFPKKRVEIRGVEELRSSNAVWKQSFWIQFRDQEPTGLRRGLGFGDGRLSGFTNSEAGESRSVID
jgi:hypothetical protein